MKFSSLSAVDLADNKNSGIENPANPANPANPIDLEGNTVANRLLISANDLLITPQDSPPTATISSGLATISNGLANQELPIADENQLDTKILAELAALAATAKPENADGSNNQIDSIKHDTLTTYHSQALAILSHLHAEHQQRLIDGGHSPKSALVQTNDWRKALRQARLDPDIALDLAEAGRVGVRGDGMFMVPLEVQS